MQVAYGPVGLSFGSLRGRGWGGQSPGPPQASTSGFQGTIFQPSGRQLSKGKDFGSSPAKSENGASGGMIRSEEEGCACRGGNGGQLGVGGWGTHIIEWGRPRVTRSTRTTSNMPARNYLPALCRTVRSRNLCVLKVTPAKVNLTQAEFQQQHVPINSTDQPGAHCVSLTNKHDVLVGWI